MLQSTVQVPARYYLHLADLLAGSGIDMLQAIRAVGLQPQALQEPDATIDFALVDTLINRLLDATGRSELGAELGPHLTVGSHSIVGFGMLSCANIADALRFAARYFRLVMPSFQLRFSYSPQRSELHFTPVVAMSSRCLAFHAETISMAAFQEINDLSGGSARALRISHAIPEPRHAEWYRRISDVELCFGVDNRPGVRLIYTDDLAAVPLALADPNSLKMAERRCQSQVAEIARAGGVADWVAMTMREVGDRLPTQPELAEMLNMSPRSLNRYLQREGTSFRKLHRTIQHEVAKQRLQEPGRSVTSVAWSLGYSEPSNFTHAFRRLEGVSPSDFRRRASRA